MGLLQLPVEVLQEIVLLATPESFEELALTCKHMYGAADAFRKLHNARRKRFRRFQFSSDDDSNESSSANNGIVIRSVIELLEQIAKEPIIARYIVSADLSDDGLGESRLDADDIEKPLIKGDKSAIRRLLNASSYLAARGYDPEAWLDAIDNRLDGHADVLLLTLLPNVKELIIAERMAEGSGDGYLRYGTDVDGTDEPQPVKEECQQILDDIAERANREPRSLAALSRLEVLQSSSEIGYDNRNSLAGVASLLAIPSVRTFYVQSVVALEDGYTGIDFRPTQDRFSPKLQEIILECSILGAHCAKRLLSRVENLRAFWLSWDVKWHGCGMTWDVGVLVACLQDTTAETLEELTLYDGGDSDSVGAFPADMKGFKRIRKLETDYTLLCARPFRPSGRELTDNYSECDSDGEPIAGDQDETDAAGDDEYARGSLVDFFPSSIERVLLAVGEFNNNIRNWEPSPLFHRMAEERATKLPHLKELVITARGNDSSAESDLSAEDGSRALDKENVEESFISQVQRCGGSVRIMDPFPETKVSRIELN